MNETKVTIRKLTHRQMKAIELWRQGGFKSKARALRNAGYGESVWRHPDKVFGSPVVQEFFMKMGIREGITFRPLKIEEGGKWGGSYHAKPNPNTEEGYELVRAPKKEKRIETPYLTPLTYNRKNPPDDDTLRAYGLLPSSEEPPYPQHNESGEVEIPSRSIMEIYEEKKRWDANANPTMGDIF